MVLSLRGRRTNAFDWIVSSLVISAAGFTLPAIVIGLVSNFLLTYFALYVVVAGALVLLVNRLGRSAIGLPAFGITFLLALGLGLVVLLRAGILVASRGPFVSDTLYYYIPDAKIYLQYGTIPALNPLGIGTFMGNNPLVSLIYAFYLFLSGSSSESFTLVPIVFSIGIAALSALFARKAVAAPEAPFLAAMVGFSLPLTDYYYFRWGTYEDLAATFLFGACLYFLDNSLDDGETKDILLFWSSASALLLTRYLSYAFIPAFFVVLAFHSNRRSLLILLADLPYVLVYIAGSLGLVDLYGQSVMGLGFTILSLISLQMAVSGSEESTSSPHLRRLLTSPGILTLSVPILWLVRNSLLTGDPFYPTNPALTSNLVSALDSPRDVIALGLVAMIVLVLVSMRRRVPPHGTRPIYGYLSVFLVSLIGSLFVSMTYGAVTGLSQEYVTSVPIGSIVYLFASPFLGSAYILPRIFAASSIGNKYSQKVKMLTAIALACLIPWSILGLQSIRYASELIPIVASLSIIGVVGIGGRYNQTATVGMSSILALGILCVALNSVNYFDSAFSLLAVPSSDPILSLPVLVYSLLLSLVATAAFKVVYAASRPRRQ
jgi:hypothetical protein